MNPNRNKEYRLSKLTRNFQKFGNIVVGVDFDFTLVDAVTNEIYTDTIELLKRCQRKEIILCIWTANPDRDYVESIWHSNDLNFGYYNYSPINPSALKPYFNILLDDSAGLNESMELLHDFLDYLDYFDNFKTGAE